MVYRITLALFMVFLCLNVYGMKVAIFDYEMRLHLDNTIAKRIEKKLKDFDQQVQINHYSGLSDRFKAYRILKNLDSKSYDLLITTTSNGLALAKRVVRKTHIIFSNINNPHYFKINKKFRVKASGVTSYIDFNIKLNFANKIIPKLSKVGVVLDGNNFIVKKEKKGFLSSSRSVKKVVYYASSELALKRYVKKLIKHGVDAIFIGDGFFLSKNIKVISRLASSYGIPVFGNTDFDVENGAFAALYHSQESLVDDLTIYKVKKFLYQKTKLNLIPVESPSSYSYAYNLKMAEKLNVKIPAALLKNATKIY